MCLQVPTSQMNVFQQLSPKVSLHPASADPDRRRREAVGGVQGPHQQQGLHQAGRQ